MCPDMWMDRWIWIDVSKYEDGQMDRWIGMSRSCRDTHRYICLGMWMDRWIWIDVCKYVDSYITTYTSCISEALSTTSMRDILRFTPCTTHPPTHPPTHQHTHQHTHMSIGSPCAEWHIAVARLLACVCMCMRVCVRAYLFVCVRERDRE